jgi:SAM-dependent methyltransferase
MRQAISTPTYLVDKQILELVSKASILVVTGRLLDIGCGEKPYACFFPGVTQYIGIDIPSLIDRTDKERRERAIDVYGSAMAIPFADSSFKTVVSFQVLEHIPEPHFVFAEISRVLENGGYLILTAPQTCGFHERPYDYYRYTRSGLRYLAERNGLYVEYIESMGGIWSMIGERISGGYIAPQLKWLGKFRFGLCAVVNLVFDGLDRLHRVNYDTLGHILVAKKVLRGNNRGQ